MTETARALNAEEVIELIHSHIAACLDGGPNRKAEDIELGRSAGLKIEMISALWDDAEKQVVYLKPIEVQVIEPASEPQAFFKNSSPQPSVERLAEKPETLTAKDEERPSASTAERRSFATEPAAHWRRDRPAVARVLDVEEEAPNAMLPAVAPKPVTVPLELKPWSSIQIPHTANELEALTYVPGLTGEIVEWIVRGAKRPNRMMALGVASVVIGTLIGRVVEGPTRSATHLFLIMLAPTGYGKDWPLQCGVKLMDAIGRSDLLGPQEWASAPGFIKRLKRNPLMVCFVDELGDELNLVNNQNGNEWVSKIIGLLKKCYNAWGTVITAEKVSEESEKILSPAPSIVGAATPESFFTALQPKDLESGFANRLVILPFEGHQRPSEQDVPSGADKPPKALITALKKLCRQPSIGERILNNKMDGSAPEPPSREPVPWGEGASKIYYAFSKKMDSFEAGGRQRYELGMRVCENAARLATNMAVGRGSPTVDREDIEWAVKLSERSFNAAIGGVERYMHEYLEFPKFCDRILDALRTNGGELPRREVLRQFGRKQRWGIELERALTQLKKEERISFEERSPRTGGPTSTVIVLVGE
jgi:Protein of unknown function (DUF3987)